MDYGGTLVDVVDESCRTTLDVLDGDAMSLCVHDARVGVFSIGHVERTRQRS